MKAVGLKVAALCALAGMAAGGGPVLAQSEGTTDVQKRLELRKQELQGQQDRAKVLEKDVEELSRERERINSQLLETAGLIQKTEGQLTESESRLEELQLQEGVIRGSLNKQYAQISQLLSALQRMGRNPPPVMITRREDALQMVRSAMLLAAAFPGMKTQALALADKLNSLVAVMDKIRNERNQLEVETARLSDMRLRLAGLMETKKQSLTERRAELDQVRVAAAEIARNVEDLNGLFQKLDEASRKVEAEANEKRRKAEAAAAAAAAAAASSAQPESPAGAQLPEAVAAAPPATAPAASEPSLSQPAGPKVAMLPPAALKPGQMVELAPQTDGAITGNPGRISPAIKFQQAKARLPLPAQGRRVLSFGDKTQYGGQSKGIVIETRRSAQITSPCDGWVLYAGEFRSYGQLLIINAGDGYHVLLAGLSQIDVQPGQFVLAAEPVGTMTGTPKSVPAGTQSNSPVLYVEFRKDGEPVNPDPWWVENQLKAQVEQKVQG